jgi:hypothetical protein
MSGNQTPEACSSLSHVSTRQAHASPIPALVLSLREASRKYVELSPSTPPFLTLRFHEKDLTLTPNLLQIRPILPPLRHILSTPVFFMTSTSANMNLVQKVYGGVKNRVKPPKGCPLCIPVTQLTKEVANRVLSRQLSSCSCR